MRTSGVPSRHDSTAVDPTGVHSRASRLACRSLKGASKRDAVDLAIRCCDLTSLEGADTPERVRRLAAKAIRPDSGMSDVPSAAAVCVYPELVPPVVDALRGASVRTASVAAAFPSGQSPREVRLDEVRRVVAMGADEIDIVLNRRALFAGDERSVVDDISAAREAAEDRTLKVILETGELGSLSMVRRAALLAMTGGADFVKTSTGKVSPGATPTAAIVLAEAVRDHAERSGLEVGVKIAGGVRTTKQALRFLVIIAETLGDGWLRPDRFRIGASSLLNDLLMQRARLDSGTYPDIHRFSVS